MGCGALHCIESSGQYRKTSERCSAGADKWLHLKTWSSAEECADCLHSIGYQIIATEMSDDAIPIQEVDWTQPTAVVFGNEGLGVSPAILERSNQRAIIPMEGFVESFNISVAAAMVLYEARSSRSRLLGHHGDLTPEQQQILLAVYYLRNKVSPMLSHHYSHLTPSSGEASTAPRVASVSERYVALQERRRKLDCAKFIRDIFAGAHQDLAPFLFREDRQKQREEIAVARLAEFCEAFRQFRAILDIEAMAVGCQQLAQLIPCIHHPPRASWMLSRLDPILDQLMADIPNRLEDGNVSQWMQIYWGTARMVAEVELDGQTAMLMKELEECLMDANEFWGNNACNMVEALFNLHGASVPQATLDRILLDARHDFKAPQTSPFNISYFLQTVVKGGFKIRKEVIAAAVENVTFHFDLLNMHHIANLIASLATLGFNDVHHFLHLFRQKLSLGSWSSQSMWSEDLVLLSHGLSQLQIDRLEVRPIIAKLYTLAQERHPPLNSKQAQTFTRLCQSTDYVFEEPINTSPE